jgi:calcium homeostasis endoplasmic reticulum protein
MSVPARPHDGQLANIIDKLAKFVARNGPEFEQMTKNKQIGNTQFQFLYPNSEFFNYYQHQVLQERRNLSGEAMNGDGIEDVCYRFLAFSGMPQQNFQPQTQQNIWSNNGSAPSSSINFTAQIETINAQQLKLREQIMQSEKNLQAQHQVISGHFAQFLTNESF